MCLSIYHFLQKSNYGLIKLLNFSSKQNDLPTRNKHQFIFSIDNLNSLPTRMVNKDFLQKMIWNKYDFSPSV
jgi:hypothetical protein